MNLTIDQIINYFSTLVLAGIGIWNVVTIRERNKTLGANDGVTNIKTLNDAVILANNRALKAEELYDVEAKKHDESRIKLGNDIFLLTKRLQTLETELAETYSLPYRITFDVVLGTAPQIVKAEILHITERRVEEKSVEVERRNSV